MLAFRLTWTLFHGRNTRCRNRIRDGSGGILTLLIPWP